MVEPDGSAGRRGRVLRLVRVRRLVLRLVRVLRLVGRHGRTLSGLVPLRTRRRAGACGEDTKRTGRGPGPPLAHAGAGRPTRAWPMADPAVTGTTLTPAPGRGNAGPPAPSTAQKAARTASSTRPTASCWNAVS
ncbi:hypothetical protein GCM10018781_00900 [Kitasatospora indigofera]|uniref:Uncharacterized protein n=1 Tax=Kitasatospora indigofera TaxID=67307 RepID=A0A919KJ21_9ACTN|nr:hypothetical protein GCM10018781_00900 [Kitasatospora indigofera]